MRAALLQWLLSPDCGLPQDPAPTHRDPADPAYALSPAAARCFRVAGAMQERLLSTGNITHPTTCLPGNRPIRSPWNRPGAHSIRIRPSFTDPRPVQGPKGGFFRYASRLPCCCKNTPSIPLDHTSIWLPQSRVLMGAAMTSGLKNIFGRKGHICRRFSNQELHLPRV